MNKLIAAVVLAAAAAGSPVAMGDVIREGAGSRRAALNAMELKPFPAEVWGKLSDWTGGKALTSADTSGQVVLICTWSGWYPPSTRALAVARRLAEDKAKDGLVVVAVHHPDGWKETEKPEAKEGVKLFSAHDEKDEFRKALLVDQDPDFYVIDRAGQLRYADIATESVDEAVTALLAETSEKAAGLTAEMAAAKAKQEEEFRKTGSIRQGVDIRAIPDVPYTDPTPEMYAAASWPRVEKTNQYELEAQRMVSLPEEGWFPAKPKVKGRAMVIYVFSPYIRRSYEDTIPAMDLLQRQNGRDLVVVGSVAPVRPDNQQNPQGEDPMALTKMAQNFVAARSLDHSILADGGAAAGFSGLSGQGTFPWVVVASSDGVVRWSGNPQSPSFRAAVDQVLRSDPGVKARRAAEEKFIRDRK